MTQMMKKILKSEWFVWLVLAFVYYVGGGSLLLYMEHKTNEMLIEDALFRAKLEQESRDE